MVQLAIAVSVLHILSLHKSGREFCGRVIGLFNHRAGNNVSHLGSYKRRAFAGLNVLELDDLHYVAVLLKGYAVSEISCCDHNMPPIYFFLS